LCAPRFPLISGPKERGMVEIWMVEVDAFFGVKRFGGVPSGSSTTVITLKSR
jgi:hypothetical protein